ncbi:3D domain-containing protein [Bacillus pumilus]|jgi:3D (Asp-Asp-Asp) domain-containing protein|uniref:3D domain-containing protein n=1 Tax=Bacillus pumilus TaxID=1408 RepID=UPI00209FC87E|nr:3D domain-containing protein [Bacillus pumilus]MCP1528593.1 3D (Asp-Asp-Asp) domain-containing protein [Bacillus pumilus]MDF9783974.1 3D (Asp-Asp-Asp) domain-containing protein [Bacillus pumilus]
MTTMTLACGLLCTQQPAVEKPAPILTTDQAALQRANQRIKTLKDEVETLKSTKAKKPATKPAQAKTKRPAHTYEVTAYTNDVESTGKNPGHPDYGVTASGARTKTGHTIACPPSMAFGTRLNIEGIGVRTCEDRGDAITEGHIDLYVTGVSEARSFGRQRLKAEIITK